MSKKKRNEKQRETLDLLKWILPTVILFLYIVFTMISASSVAKSRGRMYAEEKLADYDRAVSDMVKAKLSEFRTEAELIARNIESYADRDRYVSGLGEMAAEGNIVNGYIVDSEGRGRDAFGQETDISTRDWFKEIKDISKDGKGVTGRAYPSGEGDQLLIAAGAPTADGKGWVIMQTDTDFFRNVPSISEFDGKTQFIFAQGDGTVISVVGGGASGVSKGSSLFDSISDPGMKKNFEGEHSGILYCKYGGEERVLVYRPLKLNEWFVCELATASYIDSETDKYFEPFRSVFTRIVVAIFIFLALLAVINLLMSMVYKQNQKKLKSKAETDLLTGLLNKVSTEQAIQDYIDTAGEEEPGMFLLFDIDNFKHINDTRGHAFGDEVLATVGKELPTIYRTTDIVGRLGGDEFAVFLKDIPNDDVRHHMADTTLQFFRNFKAGEYTKYSATASIGASMFPKDGKTFEELYKTADQAVYKAKQNGRNRLEFYGDE